jgi:RNA ligase
MLHLQTFLQDGGEPSSLGIDTYDHSSLPLRGYKYSRTSPKTHPVVCESRGIVLHRDTHELAAKGFNRFFNTNEVQEIHAKFDWSSATYTTKFDGSLILLYYYANEWHVNTSGSFGLGIVDKINQRSWEQLFWDASRLSKRRLKPGLTYIFELCSIHNKVVAHHPVETVYLLSIFKGAQELPGEEIPEYGNFLNVNYSYPQPLRSLEELIEIVYNNGINRPTYEGVVVRDKNNLRMKCKNDRYVALHHLANNGRLATYKDLVPIVLNGETDEVIEHYPELKSKIHQIEQILCDEYNKLLELWRLTKDIPDQKQFALAIKDKSRFAKLLFNIRRFATVGNEEQRLRLAWVDSADKIYETLFKVRKDV